MGGANMIDRLVQVLTAHWSVFHSFLFKVVDYLWGSTPSMFSTPRFW